MVSGKKFSRFIAWTLVVLEGISLTLVGGVLYIILSRTMTKEFFQGLQVKQVEVSTVLKDRLNLLQTQLREISLNNSIRVNLMLGVKSQLLETIQRQYPPANGAFFFVQEKDNVTFIPQLPERLNKVRPSLRKFSRAGHLQSIKFRSFGKNEFLSLFSAPIKRKDDRLGTAYVCYDLAKDKSFWKRIAANYNSKLLLRDQADLVNLYNGRRRPFPKEIQSSISRASEFPRMDLLPGETLIPLKEFSGLYYATSSIPLHKKKTLLIFTLSGLCVLIFFLTLMVAFMLARRVSDPLESMADQAMAIAKDPLSPSLREEEIQYVEFRKLAQAFNRVLMSLLEAQEELKNRAKKELEASEKRYRSLVETSPAGILSCSLNWKIIFANKTAEEITGYSQADLLSMDLWDMVHPDEYDSMLQIGGKLLKQDTREMYETRWVRKNGRSIWVEIRVTRIDEAGSMVFRVNVVNITERKLAQDALKLSEEKYRLLIDNLPDIVFKGYADGTVDFIDDKIEMLTGYAKEEFNDKSLNWLDIIVGEDLEKIKKIFITALKTNRSYVREYRIRTKTGSILWLQEGSQIVCSEDGEIDFVTGAFLNVTERKLAEEEMARLGGQLQRAQKMEAIGTLAGGVAHDLNNILSGIVSYPELLLLDLPESSPLRKPLLVIKESGEKAATIVQDMLTLARRGVSVTEAVNLNDIISDYLESPEFNKLKSFHSNVEVVTELEEGLLNVIGSPIHLFKTVMNLVSNSVEAMPTGGAIVISTTNKYLDKPIKGYDDVEEGDYVVLEVFDTGIGMSSEDIKRVFEPFYTKKVMGRSGTGLGMAVVWATVKDHRGYIDIRSTEGEGTAVDIYFPVTRQELDYQEPSLLIEDYLGSEKILIVDDVAEQREIASKMLSKLGYEVISVPSGEEAVAYMENNSADLIVLDMIMEPGIDGFETYRRIIKFHPYQKAIIASGYSETQRVKEAQRLGAGTYIKKPYTLEKLGTTIRKELDK